MTKYLTMDSYELIMNVRISKENLLNDRLYNCLLLGMSTICLPFLNYNSTSFSWKRVIQIKNGKKEENIKVGRRPPAAENLLIHTSCYSLSSIVSAAQRLPDSHHFFSHHLSKSGTCQCACVNIAWRQVGLSAVMVKVVLNTKKPKSESEKSI